MSDLPVVIVGAGPQGLAAAAHLTERGLSAVVLERGSAAGAAVSEWGHVRLFSGWPELTDAAARRLLEPSGWSAPVSGFPTGAEWVSDYLAPLAAALGDRIRYGETVTGIARQGRDKVVDGGRRNQPFIVHTIDESGREGRVPASAVIDASGTWNLPNPAGADGLPAIGESAAADRISYRIPDDVSALAGSHVVIVGAAEFVRRDEGLTIVAEDGREVSGVAHVFALTGFRPDTGILREVRVDLDRALEAVAGIASEIDPNIHSCGSVGATGARQLAQPEPGLFIVGAKSYGRAPTFLALTGYEQVRSVAAHLAGDHDAAARNDLVLPDTGVCGGAGGFDAEDGGCCAAPTVLQIGSRPAIIG